MANIMMGGKSMTAFMEQFSEDSYRSGSDDLCQHAPYSNVISADSAAVLPRERRLALVTRVVEAEILPRLAHARANATAAKSVRDGVTTAEDTAALVHLLLNRDAADSAAFLDVLQARGATAATLYLGVITNAARCLGELWEEDRRLWPRRCRGLNPKLVPLCGVSNVEIVRKRLRP